ncbi:C40 family peptidase [Methylobacterium planeticum]|uniref:NlpC/P60 family protein n=1 Tax=Methylobacterium planeticum TaxID=2615211 RepID=A0A6N6MX11_9HYPH|nr:C40 family peptidase [Methylobacterium planeticum]KAB1075611.1 NlpC/P60 family protein [Methylobacterium planeticum]
MTSDSGPAPRDARLTPARPDLADIALTDIVAAERYVAPELRRLAVPSAPLRRAPREGAAIDTEAVMGDAVRVYEERDGFAYAQLVHDGYVGYLPGPSLGPAEPAPTHRVRALRTFLYPAPDLKRPPLGHLSLGAAIHVLDREGEYLRLPGDRFVFAAHCEAVGWQAPDYAGTAERLVGTPYLWGGRTSLGLDCSGLVQLVLDLAGIACPRDADQQERALGSALPPETEDLRRGDFVFWRGHVGLMLDGGRLIHANGHHMAVAVEPLRVAVTRIRQNSHGPVTGLRRLGPVGA